MIYVMMVIFGILGGYFGCCALLDLSKQRKAKKVMSDTDENADIWNAFPSPICWSGHCSCGWECKIGKTTTSFFRAINEEDARIKILLYHRAQSGNGVGTKHNPTADNITVYPVDAPI